MKKEEFVKESVDNISNLLKLPHWFWYYRSAIKDTLMNVYEAGYDEGYKVGVEETMLK